MHQVRLALYGDLEEGERYLSIIESEAPTGRRIPITLQSMRQISRKRLRGAYTLQQAIV